MEITTRTEAGLPASRASRRPIGSVVGVTWHYSTGQELGAPGARQWVRNIYAFHVGPEREWADIAYHFAIDMRTGEIIQCRPLDRVGGHSYAHNTEWVGVVFLGNDDPGVNDVSEKAWASAVWLAGHIEAAVGRPLKHEPHRVQAKRAGRGTACPGDEITARIVSGLSNGEDDMVPALVIYAKRGVDFDAASAVANADGSGTVTLDREWAQYCVGKTRVLAFGGGSAKELNGEVEVVGADALATIVAGAKAVS